MTERVENSIRFGLVLLLTNFTLSAIPSMQHLELLPAIFSKVEISWIYANWLSAASLSYIFLYLSIPRFSVGVALAGVECLIIFFTLSSFYAEYSVWRDIIVVYVDETAAFEPDWIRIILTTHTSYALGLFVFWLDNWRKPRG